MTHALLAQRLPRSGNAALAAGAFIQAALGVEFLLAGLSKAIDPEYAVQFKGFVEGSPGSQNGLLSSAVQLLVVPNVAVVAQLAKFTELLAGIVLLVAAIDVLRRRFSDPLGNQHWYESGLALLSSASGLAVSGLSLGIYLIEGGMLPRINPAFAFSSPIAVELLLVPLGLAIAWLEFGRFQALHDTPTRGSSNG
jgi:hypothetical protein